MVTPKKLNVISLGCDKNRVDTEEMLYNLSGSVFSLTPNIQDADIIIVNTCAFIEAARIESINTILEAAKHKENGQKKLIVTGCLPQKYLEELRSDLPEVDYFLGVNEYDTINSVISSLYNENDAEISRDNSHLKRILTTTDIYAYLKIADGCNNHCTFCTIPSIRGKYTSKPMEDLVDEARALIDLHGISELILVAQDVTSYGKDLYGNHSLIRLLRRLSELDIEKIRLMYCYPELIDDELIFEISRNERIAKYIDIPLQHVDSSILRLMNRRSTYESILHLITRIREIDPSISIRTTFMVGFPSETEEQFQRLYSFLESNPIDHVGIFAYSLEEDTPSAKIKNRVSYEDKLRRVNMLGELHKLQTERKNRSLIGTTQRAVYFDIDYDRNMFIARSEFNAPDIDSVIYFTSKRVAKFGEKYNIKIVGVDGFDLIGELK